MTKDTQPKSNKKEIITRSAKAREDKKRNIKKHIDSDTDNGSSESDNDDMNAHEYRKFLSKIFPSKHLNKKIKAGEKLKKTLENKPENTCNEKIKKPCNKKHKKDSEEEEGDSSSEEEKKSKKQSKKKKVKVDSETEDEISLGSEDSSDEEEEEEEEEEEDEDEEEEILIGKKNKQIKILFTIGGQKEDEEDEWETDDDSDYEESEASEDTEDEDASVSSDDDDDEDDKVNEEKKEQQKGILKKKEKNINDAKTVECKNKKELSNPKPVGVSEGTTEEKVTPLEKGNGELISQLKELLNKNKENKSIQKCLEVCEEDIKNKSIKMEKKEKKYKERNMRIFKKIVKDKNTMNDFSFYEKLEISEQKKILKELREINKITRVEKPYRMTLLESNIPVQFKGAAMKKINSLRYLEPGSGEFYKIKNWVDNFMRMPFGKYENLPISIDDGVDKCHEFMENAQKTLDDAVYGLNDAKMQIMQMLGQLLTNPKSIGTAIAIHGPPGTGKTSLVKEGISKILNRPFAFVALGGATDSSFLEGHGYTYEGSTWGKIVQILIDSKCMNPVIYFDELDKISDTPRGEEIAGILTHLTDTTQNSQFHDKYFAEINFDLSKCLFIFSYNDESKVNPILKDRMYRIQTKGYNQKQKTVIGKNYLLPKIQEQVRFDEKEIIIPDETIHYIIENHCNKEDGVRNLKRCFEIIYTKLNLYRLMKPGSNLFEEDMSLKVEFPFTVTMEIVDKLIKIDKGNVSALYSMYV
jgi:ATP-dependent Lon protease